MPDWSLLYTFEQQLALKKREHGGLGPVGTLTLICYIKVFHKHVLILIAFYVCKLTADGSICIASVNTDDSIWGTALAVKL